MTFSRGTWPPVSRMAAVCGNGRHQAGRHRGDPTGETQRVAQCDHPAKYCDGQRPLQPELGNIEGELDGREPAVEGVYGGDPHHLTDGQVGRRCEEQAQDEWDLTHGKGVSVLAEAEVNHGQLGHIKTNGEAPP
jgi:hypothetical protein